MLTKATKIDFCDWKLVFVRQVAFIMFPLRPRIIGNNITIALVRLDADATDFYFFLFRLLLTMATVSLINRFELHLYPFLLRSFETTTFSKDYLRA